MLFLLDFELCAGEVCSPSSRAPGQPLSGGVSPGGNRLSLYRYQTDPETILPKESPTEVSIPYRLGPPPPCHAACDMHRRPNHQQQSLGFLPSLTWALAIPVLASRIDSVRTPVDISPQVWKSQQSSAADPTQEQWDPTMACTGTRTWVVSQRGML